MTTNIELPFRDFSQSNELLCTYYKNLFGDRFLNGIITTNGVEIDYRTKGGYFIRASFSKDGVCTKRFYQKYDFLTSSPFNFLFQKEITFK